MTPSARKCESFEKNLIKLYCFTLLIQVSFSKPIQYKHERNYLWKVYLLQFTTLWYVNNSLQSFLIFSLYSYADKAVFAIKEYNTFISTHMYRCMQKMLCVNRAEEKKRWIFHAFKCNKHKTFKIRLSLLCVCAVFIYR